MIHQLSNLTGPKLTMVRRALDVADELWGSTPMACLAVPGKDLTQVRDDNVESLDKTIYIPINISVGN